MKSLVKLFSQNKFLVTASFLLTFLSIGIQLIWTLFVGNLSDRIVEKASIGTAFILSMVMVLFLNGFLQYVNQMVSRYTSERLAHSLRMNFADYFLSQKNTQNSLSDSEAISKVQNELLLASDYMSSTLFDIVGMGLSGLFSLMFLLMLNPLLTLIILAPMVGVVLFTQMLGKKLVPLANKAMDSKAEQNLIAHAAITNFEAIKIYEGENFFSEKYTESLERWARLEARKERIGAFVNSSSGVLSQMPLLILFVCGAVMIWKELMTIGTLVIFLNMLKNLLRTLMNLPSWMISVKNFIVHLKRADIKSCEVSTNE